MNNMKYTIYICVILICLSCGAAPFDIDIFLTCDDKFSKSKLLREGGELIPDDVYVIGKKLNNELTSLYVFKNSKSIFSKNHGVEILGADPISVVRKYCELRSLETDTTGRKITFSVEGGCFYRCYVHRGGKKTTCWYSK